MEWVSSAAQRLTETLGSTLGDDLRGVGWYTPESYELVYETDALGRCDLDRIANDLRLEALGVPSQEGLYDAGECHCVVRCFDALALVAFPTGRASGVAVWLAPTTETPFQDVIATCRRHLE